MDAHAQQEIRTYATLIGQEIVAKWVPLVWEAFVDYGRESVRLSRIEARAINLLTSSGSTDALAFLLSLGLLERKDDGLLHVTREAREFAQKLRALGLIPPWEKAE
jgi:thymidylate synthase (FAD)